MRTIRWSWGLVAVFLAQTLRAGGTDEGMVFVDVSSINRIQLQQRAAFAGRRQISRVMPLGSTDRPEPSSSFDTPAARLEIDASQLVPFQSGVFRRPGPETVVQLPIGGELYDLVIVDVTFDRSFDVYHVAAVVLGTAGGYGRFTVDRNEGTVIGTIYAGGKAWRITPAKGGEGHFLRLIKSSAGAVRNDTSLVAVESGHTRSLEARHVQMLRIAEIRPRQFHTTDTGSLVSIMGGEIERIDLSRVLTPSRSSADTIDVNEAALTVELNAAVERMQPLTLRNKPVNLKIQSASIGPANSPGDLVVRVNEVVDGLVVAPSGVITIDPTSGAIRSYGLHLVTPDAKAADETVWLSENAAIAQARLEVISHYEGSPSLISGSAQPRYVREGEDHLRPEWIFRFSANGQTYTAVVDALTGATEARGDSIYAGEYWQKICDAGGQTVTTCPPAVLKITDQTGGPRQNEGTGRCYNPPGPQGCNWRYVEAFQAIEQMESLAQNAGQPDWWNIVVVADRTGTSPQDASPRYDPETDTILLPTTGTPPYLPGVDPLSPAARQVIYHEVMHHSQSRPGNPTEVEAAFSEVLRALREGLADGGAAVMSNDWNGADGIIEEQYVRNLTTPRSIGDLNTICCGDHARAQIWGNLIFRVSTYPNVSTGALATLIFETYRRIDASRSSDPDTYDLSDVYWAMMDAAASNPYLAVAVEQVWAQMAGQSNNSGDPASGTSGGIPPPPGVPLSPTFVEGRFLHCEAGASIHEVNWLPMLGATYYEVYYSTNNGASYQYGFTNYGAVTPAYNTVSLRVAVKSCNAVGCSWISNDYYWQQHIC